MAFFKFLCLPLFCYVVATAWQQAKLLGPIRDWVPPHADADVHVALHTGGPILYFEYVTALLGYWLLRIGIGSGWTLVGYVVLLVAFCAAFRWVVFSPALNLFRRVAWYHAGERARADGWFASFVVRFDLRPPLAFALVRVPAMVFCVVVILLHW